jgi:hypothetical protein
MEDRLKINIRTHCMDIASLLVAEFSQLLHPV